MKKEIIISEKTQQAMMRFFLKTSVPRILVKQKERENAEINSDRVESERSGNK